MCGIAGFAGLADLELLERMTAALKHRGPDGCGFFHQDGIGLGSRRLAVIDLVTGAQPMTGESGATVVFNGEIYNFKALRRELEKTRRFRTNSDTEVIVHLYEEYGLEGLERLSGMYAFALWDPTQRRLILARDPLGVKPLYYAVAGKRLYFGSELKALLNVPELSRELDLSSLDQYLDQLYIPAPNTIYAGMLKLRPGERLIWKDGEISVQRFWRPRPAQVPMSRGEALGRLDRLLTEVVEDQKTSDVPLGLFLSGGLDSSVLAAYLARGGSHPEAFCIHYGDDSVARSFNELDKARRVAKHFGLRLNEFLVKPEDVEGALDPLVEAFDEPLADSSAIPTYLLCRQARRLVTVALTGIGGDEVFGGYPRYLGAQLLTPYLSLPRSLRRALAYGGSLLPERVSGRNLLSRARRFLENGTLTLAQAYAAWMGHLSDEDKRQLYGPALAQALWPLSAPLAAMRGHALADPASRTLVADLSTYLPEDLLTLADRASMASSLELRVPLCDQRLVDFALALPSELRIDGWTLKPLLKDLLKDKLPDGLVSQKKQGFMVPVGQWFKASLRPLVEDSLEGLASRGLFQKRKLDAIFAEHRLGRRDNTDLLWAFVLLERWLRRYG